MLNIDILERVSTWKHVTFEMSTPTPDAIRVSAPPPL
jgi:hypothetical protein